MNKRNIILTMLVASTTIFLIALEGYTYKQYYTKNQEVYFDWQAFGNTVDLTVFLLSGILIVIAAYMLGKYQAFDKHPKFDHEWWRMHYKLAGGDKEDV